MFKQYVTEYVQDNVMEYVYYVPPVFQNENKIYAYLEDIRINNKKTFVYGDYDVDGVMAAMIIKDSIEAMGNTNYKMFRYKSRTHKLDINAMHECLQGKYEYFIIADTGSCDMEIINRLCNAGIRLLILDHHKTVYNYNDFPEGAAIVNSSLENDLLHNEKYNLSAGALCYCIFSKYLIQYCNKEIKGLKAYALTSMYADCIDMSGKLNRSIYWDAVQLERYELPHCLQHFMNNYTIFGRRYIDFWFAPRINACFRANQLEVINYYFFQNNKKAQEISLCLKIIESIYEKSRKFVNTLVDILAVEEWENFILCDLRAVTSIKVKHIEGLENYTGLIANRLSDKYNKAAVVWAETPMYFKGSLRDRYGRDCLNIFRQFCDADGHPPAFGFKFRLLDLERFLKNLKNANDKFMMEVSIMKPIIIEIREVFPDRDLVNQMAQYNDFVGGKLPTAYIKTVFNMDFMIKEYNKYNYKYKWGDFIIQSNIPLDNNAELLLKPVKRKSVTLML